MDITLFTPSSVFALPRETNSEIPKPEALAFEAALVNELLEARITEIPVRERKREKVKERERDRERKRWRLVNEESEEEGV